MTRPPMAKGQGDPALRAALDRALDPAWPGAAGRRRDCHWSHAPSFAVQDFLDTIVYRSLIDEAGMKGDDSTVLV